MSVPSFSASSLILIPIEIFIRYQITKATLKNWSRSAPAIYSGGTNKRGAGWSMNMGEGKEDEDEGMYGETGFKTIMNGDKKYSYINSDKAIFSKDNIGQIFLIFCLIP